MSFADTYDFGYLRDRYVTDFPQFADRFDEAVAELRKFLQMPRLTKRPLAAMSHAIDSLWHTFITHTPQYAEFCTASYGGRFLHRQPRSEEHPVPAEAISNFYRDYPFTFGPLPDIWLEDIPEEHRLAVRCGEVPEAVQQLRWSGWPGW